MAAAIKLSRFSKSLLKDKSFYNATRCYSDGIKRLPWNYLWEPKKYSEKDHDKIAEKYNIPPKEYKPSSKESCLGDYPDLPMIGYDAKDPYYPYDIPTYRKNYHETLHPDYDIMGGDRYSFGYKFRIDPGYATLVFVSFLALMGGLHILGDKYPAFQPVMEKQYPYQGKVHYTFESLE